ncbi:DUF6809 family protein [Ethanoligenens harbinense]|uniref:Uncharacterized protein n=1 Tax=Ethanoligenens harbinense (strain DSM 18485 / JCM 12961 / CGMCC 1.5033 / YUAN-3) TaxID=663278 RepID=E6U9N7_ETHHY|nr:DUF6809 family protein [Ethanoligenens harbinense]ADU27323.1 hypothetical protein Ethha_1798 [Ethanoligenens harbinense YUAN-3]AVQ96388.1 hypothetical protein CXQ68_09220 [Ethanoligenens harbinense YUAN-3]AYF39046.1 hypothetical protein CXP51_09090 [Ethanoligenens harbinense]AYF41872.1 hypothetical protein CN246_09660 [Ethanoligenens harbinense]QCN92629.1 hypothetical protein DRA42_09250 [Ethanoligenens harbinense]
MGDILFTIYRCFYKIPKGTPQARRIEANHRTLITHLSKADRRLVLRIIDDKDQLINDISLDSFITGFQLAWRLANELNGHDKQQTPALER